jgi:predicted nucleic acid-binding protein
VDANIPMYAVGTPHPLKQPCIEILDAIARSEITAVTDVEILQEILHRYISLQQRTRAVEVAEQFVTTVPNVLPVTLMDCVQAMRLLERHPSIPSRDAIHAAVMQSNGIGTIITADSHFDVIPGLRRLDPADWPWVLAP